MSLILRRFLSTAILCAMLVCTALSPLSVKTYAETVTGNSSGFIGTEAASIKLPSQDPAASLRDRKEGAGINKDAVQEGKLILTNGKYRYIRSNGEYLKNGWRTIGSKSYYFNSKGDTLKGLHKVGSHYYIFSSKGYAKKGWIKYKGHYYYGSHRKKGRLLTSWLTVDGKRYFIGVNKLYRFTGFAIISYKPYYFNGKGVLQTANQVVNGQKLVFNSDGTVHSYGGVVFGKTISSLPTLSKGQQVVNYAVQFVGNPYKWGGSSLTKGCDCSGFVMKVYEHFGIQLPHYDAWIRKRGQAVKGGLANARPGDVICYDGHVAIYMGGGRIVHAADYKYGICIWNNAAYRKILSIRRFF